jgi:hypothetical protein
MRTFSFLAALMILAAPAEAGAAVSGWALVLGVDSCGSGQGIYTGRRQFDALNGAVADAKAFAAALQRPLLHATFEIRPEFNDLSRWASFAVPGLREPAP